MTKLAINDPNQEAELLVGDMLEFLRTTPGAEHFARRAQIVHDNARRRREQAGK